MTDKATVQFERYEDSHVTLQLTISGYSPFSLRLPAPRTRSIDDGIAVACMELRAGMMALADELLTAAAEWKKGR